MSLVHGPMPGILMSSRLTSSSLSSASLSMSKEPSSMDEATVRQ